MTPDIIVIGASAGGGSALREIVAGLPEDFNAAVFIVLHTPADGPALMADILASAGNLKASYPEDGQPIEKQQIYIAPPDKHLLLEPHAIRLVQGPKENLHRPAIDPLFRSAAIHHGRRVVGVILTGHLNDGTSGLLAVKQCGGVAIVQDPQDARLPSMPASALRHASVDYCIKLKEIAPLLKQLVNTPLQGEGEIAADADTTRGIEMEAMIAAMQCQHPAVTDQLGKRSTLTCPECGGTLWEMHDNKMLRYRCHVGHALTAEYLAGDQIQEVERSLWQTLKTIEEIESLATQMAAHAEMISDTQAREICEARAQEAAVRAEALRKMLLHKLK